MRPYDFMKPSVILLLSLLLFLPLTSKADVSDSLTIRYRQLYLRNQAEKALFNSDVNKAITLVSSALPVNLANPDMPLNKEVLDLLYHIHYNEDIISGNYPQDSLLCKNLQGIYYVTPQKNGGFTLVYKGERKQTFYPFNIPNGTRTIKFSPDSTRMLCQTSTGLWLLDAATGNIIGEKFIDAFNGFFSPDGEELLALSQNNIIRIINLNDRTTVQKTKLPRSHTAAYSNCGNYIALVPEANKKVVEIWNLKDETLVIRRNPKKTVYDLKFSDDDKTLFINTSTEHTRIGGIPDIFPMRHTNNILDIDISKDGKYIATSAFDYTARVWNVSDGTPVTPPLVHKEKAVSSIEFSPCGRYLLARTNNSEKVYIWDIATGKEHPNNIAIPGERIWSAKFSPCGKYIIVATELLSAYIYDFKSGKKAFPDLVHNGRVVYGEISNNGKYAVTASSGKVRVWDLAGWNGESKVRISSLISHNAFIEKAIFSPDSRKVASFSRDSIIKILDVNTGAQLGKDMKHNGFVINVAFSEDSRKLVSVSRDSTAIVWDIFTGKQILPPLRHNGYTGDAEFFADDKYLAVACWDRNISIWDLSTGELAIPYLSHDRRTHNIDVSPCNRFLVTGSLDQSARIWNLIEPDELIGLYVDHYRGRTEVEDMPDDLETLKRWYHYSEAERFMRYKDTLSAISNLLQAIPDNFENLECFNDFHIRSALDMLSGIYNNTSLYTKDYKLRNDLRLFKLSSDKKFICTTTSNRYTNVYSADSLGLLFSEKHQGPINDIVMSPDNKHIITISNNLNIGIRSITDDALIELEHKNATSIHISPDGKRLYSYASHFLSPSIDTSTLKVWDIHSGKLIDELSGDFVDIQISPDGKKLLMTDLLKKIVVLDSKDLDKQLFSFKLHGNDVNGKELYFNGLIQFSPDGKYVIFHTSNRLYVMDAYTGENKLSMEILDNQIGGITVSPCGRFLAVSNARYDYDPDKGDSDWVKVYELETGKEISNPIIPGYAIKYYGMRFLDDSRSILVYGRGAGAQTQIWDMKTGLPASAPLPSKGTYSPRFSLLVEDVDADTCLWKFGSKLVRYRPATYREIVDYYRNAW